MICCWPLSVTTELAKPHLRRFARHVTWLARKQFLPRKHMRGGLGSRNSVRPSVRLSVTRVDCDKSKWRTAYILIPHERAITLVLWYQRWLLGDAPFSLKFALKVTHSFEKRRLGPISAHNVSGVGDSEKRSIMTNIKSTTGFPTSHRWNAYVTPKCPKGWLKERFFVLGVKVNGWSSQALST